VVLSCDVRQVDLRWKVLYRVYFAIYILIFGFGIARDIHASNGSVTGFFSQFFGFITNFQVFGITLLLVMIGFAKTRPWALRHLAIPVFGLTWVVFITRMLFEISTSTSWVFSFFPDHDYAGFYKLIDFIEHVLPLLVIYQILYVFERPLRAELAMLSRRDELSRSFLPFFVILIWALFHDPSKVYHTPASANVFVYIGVPVLLAMTTLAYQLTILSPGVEMRSLRVQFFRWVAILAILAGSVIGVLLYGPSNLYRNALSWSSFLMLAILLLKNHPRWGRGAIARLLIPTYGFSLGIIMLQQFNLIILSGDQHIFMPDAQQHYFLNREMGYSIYLFLYYVFTFPIIGEILITELPYDLKQRSPLRHELREQRLKLGSWGWVQDIWQGFGPSLLAGAYYSTTHWDTRFKLKGPELSGEILSFLFFLAISLGFSWPVYQRQVRSFLQGGRASEKVVIHHPRNYQISRL